MSEVKVGDEFEAASAAPGHQPTRCTVVDLGADGWGRVVYGHGGSDRPMRVQSLLDAKQWRRITRPEAAQPAHEPPATVTLEYCDACGVVDHRIRPLHNCSLGQAFAACPGTVRQVTYDLRAEPQTTRENGS